MLAVPGGSWRRPTQFMAGWLSLKAGVVRAIHSGHQSAGLLQIRRQPLVEKAPLFVAGCEVRR